MGKYENSILITKIGYILKIFRVLGFLVLRVSHNYYVRSILQHVERNFYSITLDFYSQRTRLIFGSLEIESMPREQ
jgi:hypothetical protein